MKFELRIKIDGWNEHIIHYEQDDYQKLIVYLQALLDEFTQKQKELKSEKTI